MKDDESLVAKNKVKIIQENKDDYKEAVNSDNVKSIVKPKANSKFLGTQLAQYIYLSIAAKKDSTKFNQFLQKQFGQEPRYIDSVLINKSINNVENYLFNNGYFNSHADYSIKKKDSVSSVVTYDVYPGLQHLFGKSGFEFADSTIQDDIVGKIKIENYFNEGDAFSVDQLSSLQKDMVKNALEKGYYDFTKNSIYIDVDTLSQERVANTKVIVEDTIDYFYNQKYYIRNIYMKLGQGIDDQYPEPVEYNGKEFSQIDIFSVKPKILDRFILLNEGANYSRSKHLNTINKLYDLPIIKYANIDFRKVPVDTAQVIQGDSLFLDVFIDANANQKMSTRFEPTISEFEGPAIGAEIGFQNNNIFHGGESFDFSISGNLQSVSNAQEETEIFGTRVLEVTPKLTFPRLLFFENFFPRTYDITTNQTTKLVANYGYQNYVGLFNLKSFGLSQIWEFQTSPHNKHALSLVDISRTKTEFTPEYQLIIEQYPSLEFSYETRFILGGNYTYSYSNKLKREEGQSYLNFTGTLDLSGNLAGLLSGKDVLTIKIGDDEEVISQYVRPILNLTYHSPFAKNNYDWVNHVQFGGAFSTNKNVPDIPAVKQFYLGGSSSMRAWNTRALGPGTFTDPNTDPDRNVDQRGDMMMEFNSELRYPLTTVFGIPLRGAIFTDIGNIWSLKESTVNGREGAEFNKDRFLEEIAVGAGTGLRLDLNFLVIRGDFAWKLRDPSLPLESRWVENPFHTNNMEFQLGIGYPFEN